MLDLYMVGLCAGPRMMFSWMFYILGTSLIVDSHWSIDHALE